MYESFCTTWMASKWLWCIFQLPLMIGLRSGVGIRCLPQCFESREVALLEQLERRATASRHVVDVPVESELLRGRSAVAAADDGEAAALRHGQRDGLGAGLEARVLEHAHRAVPEHRACLGDDV